MGGFVQCTDLERLARLGRSNTQKLSDKLHLTTGRWPGTLRAHGAWPSPTTYFAVRFACRIEAYARTADRLYEKPSLASLESKQFWAGPIACLLAACCL